MARQTSQEAVTELKRLCHRCVVLLGRDRAYELIAGSLALGEHPRVIIKTRGVAIADPETRTLNSAHASVLLTDRQVLLIDYGPGNDDVDHGMAKITLTGYRFDEIGSLLPQEDGFWKGLIAFEAKDGRRVGIGRYGNHMNPSLMKRFRLVYQGIDAGMSGRPVEGVI